MISLDDAIRIVEDTLDGKVLKASTVANYLGYLAKEDGSAILAYVFIVTDATISRRLQAFVDTHSGHLLSIEDMVFHASVGLLSPITIAKKNKLHCSIEYSQSTSSFLKPRTTLKLP